MARGPREAARRALASLLVVGALAVGLGACHHPDIDLPGPPVGLKNCFEDLPLAEGALNAPRGSYVFHGVKLVSPKGMARAVKERFPKSPASRYVPPPIGTKVCAFAFTGNFAAGQVAGAPQGASGKAAVVLITTDRRLLFSFVLEKLPVTFGRAFTSP
jgi:hypothetical protein